MNFYDINKRKPAHSNLDYFAKKRLTMPRNAANSGSRWNQNQDTGRGFDAKRLYRDRLNTFNTQKNRKKLDFRQVNEEVYNNIREPSYEPPVESEPSERSEWQAQMTSNIEEPEPLLPMPLQIPEEEQVVEKPFVVKSKRQQYDDTPADSQLVNLEQYDLDDEIKNDKVVNLITMPTRQQVIKAKNPSGIPNQMPRAPVYKSPVYQYPVENINPNIPMYEPEETFEPIMVPQKMPKPQISMDLPENEMPSFKQQTPSRKSRPSVNGKNPSGNKNVPEELEYTIDNNRELDIYQPQFAETHLSPDSINRKSLGVKSSWKPEDVEIIESAEKPEDEEDERPQVVKNQPKKPLNEEDDELAFLDKEEEVPEPPKEKQLLKKNVKFLSKVSSTNQTPGFDQSLKSEDFPNLPILPESPEFPDMVQKNAPNVKSSFKPANIPSVKNPMAKPTMETSLPQDDSEIDFTNIRFVKSKPTPKKTHGRVTSNMKQEVDVPSPRKMSPESLQDDSPQVSPHAQHRGPMRDPTGLKFKVNDAFTEEVHFQESESIPKSFPVIPGTKDLKSSMSSKGSPRKASIIEHPVPQVPIIPEQSYEFEHQGPIVEDYYEKPSPKSSPKMDLDQVPELQIPTGQMTTNQALKMAQTTQLSPYEPKSNIISTLRQRKNRDTHKTWLTNTLGASISPRKRLNTAAGLNQVNAYPKRKSLKSKPGQAYESPYSVKKLITNNQYQTQTSTMRQSSADVPSLQVDTSAIRRNKSPIKPYKNDFNYFPMYKSKLPIPKPQQPTLQPSTQSYDTLYYNIQQPKNEVIQPPGESMFDDRFARLKSNSGTSKGQSIGEMPQTPIIMIQQDTVPSQDFEVQAPITVKSSFKSRKTPSPERVKEDQEEIMRKEIERARQQAYEDEVKRIRAQEEEKKRKYLEEQERMRQEELQRIERQNYYKNLIKDPSTPKIIEPQESSKEVQYIRPQVKPVKSKPVEKPSNLVPVDRTLEMVVRINMKDKGVQHINVYEGDTADGLARQFCRQHQITDREKQYKLLKSLEYQIDQHRNPPLDDEPYEEAIHENTRTELNPEIKRKVLEIFNEIWYEYDEEEGQISLSRYKQIMLFAKKWKKIPDQKDPDVDPFSDKNLEAAFNREDNIRYDDQDKVDGKISHRSVMYIAHDIFVYLQQDQVDRLKRKNELQKLRKELNTLKKNKEDILAQDNH